MHEYTIAYDLYVTTRRAAIENNATQVKKVSVEVGKMAMVNPEQVVYLFDMIKEEDPLFTTAVLECNEMSPQTRCSCGYSGDEIFVYYQNQKYTYLVNEVKTVDSQKTDYLNRNFGQHQLTLMTCWPPGTTLKRLLVTATLKNDL